MATEVQKIAEKARELSSDIDYSVPYVSIILAAGHGKRIKSHRSKMLHEIWKIPTVERVYTACNKSFPAVNSVVVVGIKALDVMKVIGKRPRTAFALQENQKGTGHAVQIALIQIDGDRFDGTVFVLPGDMGLINAETLQRLSAEFDRSKADMMVLVGTYEGDPLQNSYGRILRAKAFDSDGRATDGEAGAVLQILEYKDILSLPDDQPYQIRYRNRTYSFSKEELLHSDEFNSGVYAFKFKPLKNLIGSLRSDNVQNEIYITDLIAEFNAHGLSVAAAFPEQQYVLMGFNNKSVLKEMDSIARDKVYQRIKDVIEIDDPEDFFIDESIIAQILELDQQFGPLDIHIGKGVSIGKGAVLNSNLTLKKNVHIEGRVLFGKNVTIGEDVLLSCYEHQLLRVGDDVEILRGDMIKGNIDIGKNTRIESSVNITGSDEYPTRIGSNVLIKGTSYIFGSNVEDDVSIEHSVIVRKVVDRILKRDGTIQPVRYYIPMPEGIDCIEEIKKPGK